MNQIIENETPKNTFEPDPLAAGNTKFALDLYQQLRENPGNLFFSPYSISAALAMTLAGAGGNTLKQMAEVLAFSLTDEALHAGFAALNARLEEVQTGSPNRLMIANALWPQKGYKLRRTFRSLVKKHYGVKIKALDFADSDNARAVINQWVEDKTESKIKDLIGQGVLNHLTRLVLANAIYFKGTWQDEFDPGLTSEQPFQTASDTEVPVQMMHQKQSLRYTEDETLQVLEIPYKGRDLSMVILLPREPDGVDHLEKLLTPAQLTEWIATLEETEVNFSLPRFNISFPLRLDDTLKSLGMVDAFSGNSDFSAMQEDNELKIGAVLHKAYVDVNEEGTEAAAATAVVMVTKSVSFMTVDFIADHPFIFFVRENNTGSLLFLGRLINPA